MTNNTLALIALCNEYCATIERAQDTALPDFVAKVVKLLPRIYITTWDIPDDISSEEGYIDSLLAEDVYDTVSHNLELAIGEKNVFLEVFEEDMKYSDTPIAATISESLADLFQVFYNFIETVRDAPEELVDNALSAFKEDFKSYWSQILCNVMRPLNNIAYNSEYEEL